MTFGLNDCLCPWNENGSLARFSRSCPVHGSMAAPATEITKPWCSGSSEPVSDMATRRLGVCRACSNYVPAKYGIAGVHLRDGSTPRE